MKNALFILLISSAFTLGACSSMRGKHDCACGGSKGAHAHAHHDHKDCKECKDGACDMKAEKEQK